MRQLKITSQASAYLDEIWLYIARDRIDAADAMIEHITDRFKTLLLHPQSGRKRSDIADGIRSMPVGSYVVYYKPFRSSIAIIRFLHGGRDIEPLL